MKELLSCAMDIGEQMMISGAEVHRVEDSMNRICLAFGAVRVDCFIIPSSMVTTVYCADGSTYTQTRRIHALGTNFHKLDRLNQLSRKICSEPMTTEQIQAEITAIVQSKTYPFWLECLAYAAIAGAFTLFFGGDFRQTMVSLLIGGLVRFLVLFSDRAVKNLIFSKLLSTVSITAMAFLFFKLGIVAKVDEIIIGNIMLLISGLGFTNALRDLFTGDSIAGILRSLEAVLCAVAIAAGYFLFVFAVGGAL